MESTTVEQRLRIFLLWVAGALCAGTIVELYLAKHTKEPMQFVPFALCALGLLAVVSALRRPSRASLWSLRGVMGVLMLGSLLGVYEHLIGNLEFQLEMRPGAAWTDVWFTTLRGAAPLLAPGILALAAALAIAATYQHPALRQAASPVQPQPSSADRSLPRSG